MNLLAMRSDLRRKVGNPSTAQVSDASLNIFLNTAYRNICGKYAFTQLRKTGSVNTVVNASTVALPTDAAAIIRVWDDTNKVKLSKGGPRYLTSIPLNLPTGKPKVYVRDTSTLVLVPTPDAIYTLKMYYMSTITELSSDGDVPVLVDYWHEGIVLKARHLYYDEKGDVGKAIYAVNAFKDWMADKPSEMDIEKTDFEDKGVIISTLGGEYARRGFRDRQFDPLFDYTDR